MSNVYFFNDIQRLIKVVSEQALTEVIQEQEITAAKSELLNDTLSVVVDYHDELKEAAYMAVRELDLSFSMYRIYNSSDSGDQLTFTGVGFAPDELAGYVVENLQVEERSIKSVAQLLVKGTDWTVGYVDDRLAAVSGEFSYLSIKEALKQLQELGCEIVFKCQVEGRGISRKWMAIYQQIGEVSNTRFTYGEKALSIIREQDRSQIYTSLIGRGKSQDVGDGQGKKLDFKEIEWKKSRGNPLNKPKGQQWLELPEMTAAYGIPMSDGSMGKREKVVTFDNEDNPKKLLERTYEELVACSRPLVQFKTTTLSGDAIGNWVTVHRDDRGYHYETRVFKVKTDRLTGKSEAGLGDNMTKSASRNTATIQHELKALDERKMTFQESEDIAKWQSDVVRGAKGGSIIMMNPSDTGESDSRVPNQMVWMNGPTLDASDNFLVANSQGIGFVDGPFDMTDFKPAWSIDGTFDANYIKAGVLRAIDIIGVTITGSTITTDGDNHKVRLKNGMLSILNDDNEVIGSLFASYSSATGKANGVALQQGKNEILSLNTSNPNDGGSTYVIQIPKESNSNKPLINSRGKWHHDGDLNINGRLTLNGQEVTPGGSGGNNNWDGQYPPEVTTGLDKRAWEIWITAINQGHAKESAAGMMGNIQRETGDMSPTANERPGVPGYGYGLVQWTDSTQTYTGRDYMIGLMDRAQIKDKPDTIQGQMKLIDWHAKNGQWIPTGEFPQTWAMFKQMTNIDSATMAFLKNFERAGVEASGERIQNAHNWYNKFKNLKPPVIGTTFKPPISGPITVTSEFGWRVSPLPPHGDELHNGIDLVNGNPNTPIYAAMAGQVVVAGNYPDWYGLYIVIKHPNGKYTGYAHNSSLNVSVGQQVAQSQQIAVMGTTGPSTGEHCHFQIMSDVWPSNEGFENPRPYILG